jgi:hypothetical protein
MASLNAACAQSRKTGIQLPFAAVPAETKRSAYAEQSERELNISATSAPVAVRESA